MVATVANLNYQLAKEELVPIQGVRIAESWETLKKDLCLHVLKFHVDANKTVSALYFDLASLEHFIQPLHIVVDKYTLDTCCYDQSEQAIFKTIILEWAPLEWRKLKSHVSLEMNKTREKREVRKTSRRGDSSTRWSGV